jgi:putative ABC transport system substrate-binding protein
VAGTSTHPAPRLLIEGLAERGWVPGKNLEFVWRSAEGHYGRLPELAKELAAEADIIVAYGPGIDAAMKATTRIPIVMAVSGVPGRIEYDGIVRIQTLARPGGNVTGLTLSGGSDFNGKRLELVKLVAPRVKKVAILGHDLPHASAHIGPRTRQAAETLGLDLVTFSFESLSANLEPAFAAMARDRVDAVIVTELPATNLVEVQTTIHRLAQRHAIVAMHEVLSAADSGGLIAYGTDITKLYRRSAHYVDRILRGATPGDLPIEQPTDFELRINVRTAKAMGLEIPQVLRLQATRLIE